MSDTQEPPESLKVYSQKQFLDAFGKRPLPPGPVAIMAHTPKFLLKRRDKLADRDIRFLLTGPLDPLRDGRLQYMGDPDELIDVARELEGRLTIRQWHTLPSVGLVIFDSQLSVTVYTPDRDSKAGNKSTFVIPASGKAAEDIDPSTEVVHDHPYDFYRAEFERLWSRSTPLDPSVDPQFELLRLARQRYDEIRNAAEKTEVAIVIALDEEYRYFEDALRGVEMRREQDPITGQYVNHFTLTTPDGKNCRCIATLVGAMGHTRMAQVVERLVGIFDVQTVVSIGIAGAAHDDAKIGDVVVPSQINNYLENAKAKDNRGGGYHFVLGGQAFQSTDALRNEARVAGHDPVLGPRWSTACRAGWDRLDSDHQDSARDRDFEGVIRGPAPELFAGGDHHIASGPVLATSDAFVEWLRNHQDRKVLAIEMEAGGAMAAAHFQRKPPQTLVVRGISDIAYTHTLSEGEALDKSRIEKTFGVALRRLAMQNATHLLRVLIEAGKLRRPD